MDKTDNDCPIVLAHFGHCLNFPQSFIDDYRIVENIMDRFFQEKMRSETGFDISEIRPAEVLILRQALSLLQSLDARPEIQVSIDLSVRYLKDVVQEADKYVCPEEFMDEPQEFGQPTRVFSDGSWKSGKVFIKKNAKGYWCEDEDGNLSLFEKCVADHTEVSEDDE